MQWTARYWSRSWSRCLESLCESISGRFGAPPHFGGQIFGQHFGQTSLFVGQLLGQTDVYFWAEGAVFWAPFWANLVICLGNFLDKLAFIFGQTWAIFWARFWANSVVSGVFVGQTIASFGRLG